MLGCSDFGAVFSTGTGLVSLGYFFFFVFYLGKIVEAQCGSKGLTGTGVQKSSPWLIKNSFQSKNYPRKIFEAQLGLLGLKDGSQAHFKKSFFVLVKTPTKPQPNPN